MSVMRVLPQEIFCGAAGLGDLPHAKLQDLQELGPNDGWVLTDAANAVRMTSQSCGKAFCRSYANTST